MRYIRFSNLMIFAFVVGLACFASATAQTSTIPANWKTYTDSTFSFRYPPNLTLKKTKEGIELFHLTKFRHEDPCGAEDGDQPLKVNWLEDFRLVFKFDKSETKLEVNKVHAEDWETIIDGYIDTGNFKGQVALNAVEGCGNYFYTFPAKAGNILTVKRLIVSLFEPTTYQNGDRQKALKLKNVIKPEAERQIFKTIIESIKFP